MKNTNLYLKDKINSSIFLDFFKAQKGEGLNAYLESLVYSSIKFYLECILYNCTCLMYIICICIYVETEM